MLLELALRKTQAGNKHAYGMLSSCKSEGGEEEEEAEGGRQFHFRLGGQRRYSEKGYVNRAEGW